MGSLLILTSGSPHLPPSRPPRTLPLPPPRPPAELHPPPALFASIVLLFFSLSTNQEYYTFPAYLPILLLIAATITRAEQTFAFNPSARRWTTFAHAAFTLLGAVFALALVYGLWASRHRPFVADIGDLLAHRGVGDYTLSMSHLFDLTADSFAALRLPAALAAFAFATGPALAWLLRAQRRHLAATTAIAFTSGVFLLAAHIALGRFGSMLSSQPIAARIQFLESASILESDTRILLYGDQSYGSSIPFYLNRQVGLVDGRSTSMLFGSTFPDAPLPSSSPARSSSAPGEPAPASSSSFRSNAATPSTPSSRASRRPCSWNRAAKPSSPTAPCIAARTEIDHERATTRAACTSGTRKPRPFHRLSSSCAGSSSRSAASSRPACSTTSTPSTSRSPARCFTAMTSSRPQSTVSASSTSLPSCTGSLPGLCMFSEKRIGPPASPSPSPSSGSCSPSTSSVAASFGERGGLYAALALGTSIGPYLYTRFYIPDILIGLWMTLTVHLFLIALDRARSTTQSARYGIREKDRHPDTSRSEGEEPLYLLSSFSPTRINPRHPERMCSATVGPRSR